MSLDLFNIIIFIYFLHDCSWRGAVIEEEQASDTDTKDTENQDGPALARGLLIFQLHFFSFDIEQEKSQLLNL